MTEKSEGRGVGWYGVTQIVFIILKLAGLVSWSWWAVFSPTLLSVGLIVLVLVIIGLKR